MAKRVTIMLDDDNSKELRKLQAKLLRTADGSVSFSSVINQVVRKSLA